MPRDRERTSAPGERTIQHDPVSEGMLLAAAMIDEKARARVLAAVEPDHLFEPKHRGILAAMKELDRQKLAFDVGTLQKLGDVDADYARLLVETHSAAHQNVEFHVQRVLWDAARLNAARGPVDQLVKALNDPLAEPDRVRALARSVSISLDDYKDRRYLRDPGEVIHESMAEMRAVRAGQVSYSYGVDRLDYYERRETDHVAPARRMVPGAAPGQITCITGLPGVGKSTLTARIALGLAREGRRVLYGAWEMKASVTMRLLAGMSVGLPRSRIIKKPEDGGLTDAELEKVEKRAWAMAPYIRFLDIPFNRGRGEKRTNDRNLDILQGYIADSGCDVFIGDLWKRMLRQTEPDDEEQALIRQQAMAEELKIHCILVQQQRLKDVEARPDKRPTREGIKGSGAWIEVPDTILGVHRPAQWKDIPDNIFEIDVLKQRYGVWPQAIEFDWDPDTGLIINGRTVPYDNPGGSNGDALGDYFKKGRGESEPPTGKRRRREWR